MYPKDISFFWVLGILFLFITFVKKSETKGYYFQKTNRNATSQSFALVGAFHLFGFRIV